MFSGGFFFFDQFVDKPWHTATAETPRRVVFGFPLWVTHEAFVERLFRSYKVIVIKASLPHSLHCKYFAIVLLVTAYFFK